MSGDLVIQMAQEALRMVLLISAPMLGLGLLVSGNYLHSGADAGFYTEDCGSIRGNPDFRAMDAEADGGICDQCAGQSALLYRLSRCMGLLIFSMVWLVFSL